METNFSMKRITIKYLFVILLILGAIVNLKAQIYSSTDNYSTLSNYTNDFNGTRDSLFFFNNDSIDGTYQIRLQARTFTNATYTWSMYNLTTFEFSEMLSGANATEFNLDSLSENKMAVQLVCDSAGIKTDTFRCWIFKNLFEVGISKASDDSSTINMECDYFLVNVYKKNQNILYYNPSNANSYTLDWKTNFEWEPNVYDEEFDANSFPKDAGTKSISHFKGCNK